VSGESFEICSVAGQHRAPRFSQRHNERVDCRTGFGPATELGGSTGNGRADRSIEDAGLQEAVGIGIAPGVTAKRFHEDHGRYHSGPQPGST